MTSSAPSPSTPSPGSEKTWKPWVFFTNILSRNQHSGVNVAEQHLSYMGCPKKSMLLIRIRLFLGLLDPDPDPWVRGKAPDPDPSIIKQKL
jgi:hypothetical protein